MEDLKRQKGELDEALTARIIRERAKGRCEYVWTENQIDKRRCTELHKERANSFAGYVQLQLVPTNGLTDRRVNNLKAYCQRHAYELLGEIQKAYQPAKRVVKPERGQVNMFGGGI